MSIKSSLIPLFTLSLFSCSNFYMIKQNHHMEIKADPEKAVLVIYRSTSYGFSSKVDIFLDNKFIGQTKGKCYFTTKSNPGTHYLTMISENKTCAQLTLEAEKVYYILQTIYPGRSSIQSSFSESDPDNFSKEIAGLEYLTIAENKEVPQMNNSEFDDLCRFERQKGMLTFKPRY